MKYILVVMIALLATACTNESKAREALESQGFINIEVGGYAFGECSDSDGSATSFTATNSNGRQVSGTVCCGYVLKGCTVRW